MFQDEKLCLEKKDLEDARCRKVFHEVSLVEVRIELLKVCEHKLPIKCLGVLELRRSLGL